MNKILKAKNKLDRKENNKFRKWWVKNRHIIFRTILFPIWITLEMCEKYKNNTYEKMEYSPKLTKKYLDKILPKMVVGYCYDVKNFTISNSNDAGDIRVYDFSRKNKYLSKFSHLLLDYIINEYEIEGYKKFVMNTPAHWRKASQKLEWYVPYDYDTAKGVLFCLKDNT